MATLTQEQRDEIAHARKVLEGMLEPGQRIGTVTTHGRGMTDWVECFAVSPGTREIVRITYYVARVCGYKMTEKGIERRGCQYDKAHDVVNTLAQVLYGDGQALIRDRLLGFRDRLLG